MSTPSGGLARRRRRARQSEISRRAAQAEALAKVGFTGIQHHYGEDADDPAYLQSFADEQVGKVREAYLRGYAAYDPQQAGDFLRRLVEGEEDREHFACHGCGGPAYIRLKCPGCGHEQRVQL